MIETVLTKKSALLVIPLEEVNYSALREEELCSLVKTMGVDVISSIVFRVREYNSATMLGKGQVEEVKENILYYEPDLVVFDTSLEPRI